MIKVTNLIKRFKERTVLKSLNYSFPKTGLCIIFGPSGCGKTTFLNCLAGLLPFEGNIALGHINLEGLSDNELSRLRLTNYGFIFQDFKLFENETVLANLLFPLETIYSLSKEKKQRKCQDLLALVGLLDKEKQIVNKLSGGEKQRVAIARALINDPQVLLADEPTGSLDEKNSTEIMNILKIVSKKSLVIMVSHDQDLTKKYADEIIEMDDGNIINISHTKSGTNAEHLPIAKNGSTNKKAKIPDSFLIKHTYHNMKQKKWRTIICYSMTSLGLIGVGLAFALSSSIATNIKDAYKDIVDENSLVFSLKEQDTQIKGQFAASYYEVQQIKEEYSDYIEDIGATYLANFERFFPDHNALVLKNDYRYCPIDGFSARHINDFTWLEDIDTVIYPEKIEELENDEVVLGLNYQGLIDICFELQIEKTVRSLSEYLQRHELYLYFDFENGSWEYSDQQLLRMVGFTLETDLKIYHSNHLWNEYMFEERMSFPSNDALSIKDEIPWMMKKIYYLKMNSNRDDCLNLFYLNKEMDRFIFEIANETYYPWLYCKKEMKDRNRVLVFDNTVSHIPLWHIPYMMGNDSNLNEPIIANYGGYVIYAESLMMGFAKTMYFATDYEPLETIIDYQTTNSKDGFYQEELPDGVFSGNFAKSLQNGIQYSVFTGNLVAGRAPISLSEIVISDTFYRKLGYEYLDQTLYVATSQKDMVINGEKVISDYVLIPLTVVGIVHSNKTLIYHQMNWPILFYQCQVGTSAFNLQCQNLSFSLKNTNKIEESINAAKKAFPQYNVVNPLSDINESVDTVCFYITIVLIVFSIITTTISVLLLTICNYIYIIEGRKEIALARCLGVNKKESQRFLYFHSLMQTIISFVIASVELIIISVVANMEIGRSLSIGFSFSFNPLSLLPMLGLSLGIGLLSSFIMAQRINRINPIEALKA